MFPLFRCNKDSSIAEAWPISCIRPTYGLTLNAAKTRQTSRNSSAKILLLATVCKQLNTNNEQRKVLEQSFYSRVPFLTSNLFGWKPSPWCKHLLAGQQRPQAYFKGDLYSPCRTTVVIASVAFIIGWLPPTPHTAPLLALPLLVRDCLIFVRLASLFRSWPLYMYLYIDLYIYISTSISTSTCRGCSTIRRVW